jgi:polar amino acid transport system substrate-binding protein
MYLEPETGEPAGVVPDLSRVLADDLGIRLELVDLEWDDHMPALVDGRVDLLMSFGNTPARALSVEFAQPLLPHEVLVLVRTDGPVRSVDDLRTRTARVAAAAGSSVAEVARRRFPDAEVLEVADPAREVLEGRAEASVQDAITRVFLERNPALRPVREPDGRLLVVSREYGHPAIRPDDARFLNWLNNWIDYHRAQGTIERLCDAPLRESLAG